MEFSFIILCTKRNYDKDLVEEICLKLLDLGKRVTITLCTNNKNTAIARNNISLNNLNASIFPVLYNCTSEYEMIKRAVNSAPYKNTVVIRLDKFSEENLQSITSLDKVVTSSRFDVIFAENLGFYLVNSYDLKLVLDTCKSTDLRDIFNLLDYSNFRLNKLRGTTLERISFLEFLGSERRYKKYIGKRTKSIKSKLCEYDIRF